MYIYIVNIVGQQKHRNVMQGKNPTVMNYMTCLFFWLIIV